MEQHRPGKFKRFLSYVKSFFWSKDAKVTLIDVILKTIDIAKDDFPKVKMQIEEIVNLIKEKGIELNEDTLQELLDITITILKCEKDLKSIREKIKLTLDAGK